MLAFRHKQPQQVVLLDKQLGPKVDTAVWGPGGRVIVQQTDGMRERMKGCLEKMTDATAEELKDVLVKYLSLLFKASAICRGISLTEAELGFKWSDAFDPNLSGHVDDWTFERASVLFSLGASYAFTATHRDRQTAEGIKQAAADFQLSAGVLDMLHREMREATWKGSPDLSLDTLDTLKKLMLAQAQKCFYEKARDDDKSASIMSKMTAECAALYQDVSSSIQQAKSTGRPIAAMSSEWLDVVEWNRLLFDGLQHYYLSKVHCEAFEYGKQLCRLTYAAAKCGEAVSACVGAAPALRKQFVDAHALCSQAHAQATKDNELIYNEKVPAFNTLPKPERLPRSLVNATVPPVLSDPSTFVEPERQPQVAASPTPPPAAPAESAETPPAPPVAAMAGMAVAVAATPGDEPPPSFEQAEALGLDQLIAMGFDREKAAAALAQHGGSVDAATNALLAGGT